MINNNKLNNTDYRHRVSKLSVGRVNLKLKIQHSKRDKDKIKNKINNIRINYDFNNINNNSGINHKNSLINKKGSIKEYSRDKRAIIEKNKKLSIISNNNDILNYNNYKTNDNNKKNNNCMDINNNENENENNPYTNITLNTNNPCANNNDEKDRINKNYGFIRIPPKLTQDQALQMSLRGQEWNWFDLARTCKELVRTVPDFYKANFSGYSKDGGEVDWLLRTPALVDYFGKGAYFVEKIHNSVIVKTAGSLEEANVDTKDLGVVPAICIN